MLVVVGRVLLVVGGALLVVERVFLVVGGAMLVVEGSCCWWEVL